MYVRTLLFSQIDLNGIEWYTIIRRIEWASKIDSNDRTDKVQPSLIQRQVIRQLTYLITKKLSTFFPLNNNIYFSFFKLNIKLIIKIINNSFNVSWRSILSKIAKKKRQK